ncbi:MAG: DUF4867 family protein [Clostridiales bacterium]|nr:DUF4867 family protein [Clostridiales bacterium]
MERIESLNKSNDFRVFSIFDAEFSYYGRVVNSIDAGAFIKVASSETVIPESGNVYVPSFAPFEAIPEFERIKMVCYGGMPIQAGYCNGKNSTFNGFEYHKSSEINIAVTEFCLALGHCWDIADDLTYDVKKAEVFFVPEGVVFEMFGTTLHLSPLRTTTEGFRDVVILLSGTNTPLSNEEKNEIMRARNSGDMEAKLLLHKNKWVISHPDREPLIRQGAYPGVTGENIELKL